MTFDEWMQRPVYLAQCATQRKAVELNIAFPGFRARPKFRDGYSQLARDFVAWSVHMDRLDRNKS